MLNLHHLPFKKKKKHITDQNIPTSDVSTQTTANKNNSCLNHYLNSNEAWSYFKKHAKTILLSI